MTRSSLSKESHSRHYFPSLERAGSNLDRLLKRWLFEENKRLASGAALSGDVVALKGLLEGRKGNAFDLHIHSDFSDALMGVEAIAAKAKSRGLKGVAITDHNTFRSPEEHRGFDAIFTAHGLIYVPGVEITLESGVHFLLLFSDYSPAVYFAVEGILRELGHKRLGLPDVLVRVSAIIEDARSTEDFEVAMVLTHPSHTAYKAKARTPREERAIVSAMKEHAPFFCGVDVRAATDEAFAKKYGIRVLSGSDSHVPVSIGFGYTLLNATDRAGAVKEICEGSPSAMPPYRLWAPVISKYRDKLQSDVLRFFKEVFGLDFD